MCGLLRTSRWHNLRLQADRNPCDCRPDRFSVKGGRSLREWCSCPHLPQALADCWRLRAHGPAQRQGCMQRQPVAAALHQQRPRPPFALTERSWGRPGRRRWHAVGLGGKVMQFLHRKSLAGPGSPGLPRRWIGWGSLFVAQRPGMWQCPDLDLYTVVSWPSAAAVPRTLLTLGCRVGAVSRAPTQRWLRATLHRMGLCICDRAPLQCHAMG